MKAWGTCGSLETKDTVPAMRWEAEAVELFLQLTTVRYEENGWLPKHLVGLDLGLNPAAITSRYVVQFFLFIGSVLHHLSMVISVDLMSHLKNMSLLLATFR